MSDDTRSPQPDDETQAGLTQAAHAEALAWSDATSSQPVIDYYAEPRWRGLLPKLLAPAVAAGIGGIAVWLWMSSHHQAPAPPQASQAAPSSASQVAPPSVVPPPPQAVPPTPPAAPPPQTPAVSATDISTALTSRGRTGNAFEACYFIPDENGYPNRDPEQPYALGLVGWTQQWADITAKLNRLGVNIETDAAGVVSGIAFADEQSRRAWANWWAVAKCSI